MAATLLWDGDPSSEQKPQENSLEDLFVFGYACKLFRNDEKAKSIDEGKHLIPWMGDERLMIDRYDGRGHLFDLSKHDADLMKPMPVELSEQEAAVEAACEEERYLELHTDIQEKAMHEEEEWKRYYESLHEGYNAVGFSYEHPGGDAAPNAGELEEEDNTFVPSAELLIPEGIEIPQTEKEHARIVKTATFIAKHGIQMEIMIKTKQSKNPQFEFMNFENSLNLYYKHMVKVIKEGKYRPQQEEEPKEEQDMTLTDQHYLHPSLSTMSMITPLPPPPPTRKHIVLPKVSIHDTPYGQLVTTLKKYSNGNVSLDARSVKKEESVPAPSPLPPFMAQPDYAEEAPQDNNHLPGPAPTTDLTRIKEERIEPPPPGTEVMGPLPRPASHGDLHSCENRSSPQPQIVPPPPDVQPIIDRMAMYVAKNGVEFELVVKSKKDQRFSFLEAGHVHYQYYDFKKNMFLKEAELKKRLEAKQAERERQKKEEAALAQANRSISFSIKGRSKEPESSGSLKGKRPLFDYDSSEGEGDEEGRRERDDKRSKSRSSSPDSSESGSGSNSTSGPTASLPVAAEVIPPARTEEMEKKQAEERLKDKLAVAAREKLAASGKEKQLQLERKKKAALFINLLRIVKEGDKEEGEVQSSPSATPASSKAVSPAPVVFEYNNRSGTPTRMNEDLIQRRRHKTRSKSPPPEVRKKRRKKSPTPPSAYANPHKSPPKFNPIRRRSRTPPRRGLVGSRRMSPVRPFPHRSRRSPSPPPRNRDRSPLRPNRSPARRKATSKKSRTPSPVVAKHKKKHKRSRSKTPKKKKKDKARSRSKDRESKSGRSRDKSDEKYKEKIIKKKAKEKKKEKKDKETKNKEKDRLKSKHTDRHSSSKSDKDKWHKNKTTSKSSVDYSLSSSASRSSKPRRLSPEVVPKPRPKPKPKAVSPIPQVIDSSSSESSSSSDDEEVKNGSSRQLTETPDAISELPSPRPSVDSLDLGSQEKALDIDVPAS